MASLKSNRKGLSLIEVVVSTPLVGLVLVGALNGVGTVFEIRQGAVEAQVGPSLASDLLAEIMGTTYTDEDQPNGPIGLESGESGSNRLAFDDVDDYHNWSSASATKKDGTTLAYGNDWQHRVTVGFVIPNSLASTTSDTGLKLITVTVSPPAGASTVLQSLSSQRGISEYRPSSQTTYVTACQVELQANSSAVDVIAGKELKNHAIGP